MVAWHFCVRVLKEAIVLLDKGYQVYLITNQLKYGSDKFTATIVWQDEAQLERAIKILDTVDIWHVHNEPDWIAERVLRWKKPNQKMIWDIHDFETARWDSTTVLERNIIRGSDGIVHVSNAMRDYALSIYEDHHPSCIVLPCLMPAKWYQAPKQDHEIWGDCVYEGGLDVPYRDIPLEEQHEKRGGVGVSIRDYGLFFEALKMAGKHVTVYPSITAGVDLDGAISKYINMGVQINGSMGYESLLGVLGKYKWGLVGSGVPSRLMNNAMPNKLFEYIACGVPLCVYQADEAARFVEEHKIGIVLKRTAGIYNGSKDLRDREIEPLISQIKEKMTDKVWQSCRKNLLALRDSLSMDSNIHLLEEFYQRTMAGEECKAKSDKQTKKTGRNSSKEGNGKIVTDAGLLEMSATT